jgi:L-ascorbate metabolism protein UlaG (beta-lactamase superfamily)
MTRLFAVFAAVFALAATVGAAPTSTNLKAKGGEIVVKPIFHASMEIDYAGKVIYVDPVSAGDYSKAPKADLIFITDIHGDHMDEAALAQIAKTETLLVAPQAVLEQMKNHDIKTLRIDNGQSKSALNIPFTALPMYNLVRGPKAGQYFHTKGRGNGYVINLGGKRLYIAGDTEVTPEMKKLKKIDMAFLPMNLPFTMTPQEAAEGVKIFKPKVAVPYHYRYPFDKANYNQEQFAAALKGSKAQALLLEWYPADAVARATKK